VKWFLLLSFKLLNLTTYIYSNYFLHTRLVDKEHVNFLLFYVFQHKLVEQPKTNTKKIKTYEFCNEMPRLAKYAHHCDETILKEALDNWRHCTMTNGRRTVLVSLYCTNISALSRKKGFVKTERKGNMMTAIDTTIEKRLKHPSLYKHLQRLARDVYGTSRVQFTILGCERNPKYRVTSWRNCTLYLTLTLGKMMCMASASALRTTPLRNVLIDESVVGSLKLHRFIH